MKIALTQRPRLTYLTEGLPNLVTRKAWRTSAYKIYLPINFTYIDEMTTFLRKSKFPMINIATIIIITNQNCFLLWSDVFIFGTIQCLGQGILVLINCSISSLVSDNLISYSPSAHDWGRFCWRSRLGKLDFTFSLVKNEIQVALEFWRVDLCRQRIFTTCHLENCWYRVCWYLQQTYIVYPLSILKVIFVKSN